MTWNELQHDRSLDGRFTEMVGTAPETTLTAFTPDARFYPCAGDLQDRAGEQVSSRYIEDDEDDEDDECARMFAIEFEDGTTSHAYEEEVEHDDDPEPNGTLPGADRPPTVQERFELVVRGLAANPEVSAEDLAHARDLGGLVGHTVASVTARIGAIRRGEIDLYEHLPYGPSAVTRGESIGYHAGPSRLTREYVAPDERWTAARSIAAWSLPSSDAADPEHWMERFDAYDAIDEYEVPEDVSVEAVQGARSVSRQAMNLDLDHQPMSHTIRVLAENERLAASPGPYRTSADPQRQAALDEAWDARRDRLREVRLRMERIDETARARRERRRLAADADERAARRRSATGSSEHGA